MLQKKSIVFSFSLLFGVFFCMLISILLVGIYFNMTTMYDRVNNEKANGIHNVLTNDFEIELKMSKHALNILYATLQNQVTENMSSDEVAKIVTNQTYLTSALCLILLVDNESIIIHKTDKFDITTNFNYQDLVLERSKTDRSFIRKVNTEDSFELMLISQKNFALFDNQYVLFVGCDTDIIDTEFINDGVTHFKVMNARGEIIFTDPGFVTVDEMSGSYVSEFTKEIKTHDNVLTLTIFSRQHMIDVFGYGNLIISAIIILLIIVLYGIVVYYLFKSIIDPIHRLKTDLQHKCESLSNEISIRSMDTCDTSSNEITNLVRYFDYAISYIYKFIQIVDDQKTKLANLINSMDVGIIEIDTKTHKILNINTFATKTLGLTEDEVMNTHCYDHLCSETTGCCLHDPIQCIIEDSLMLESISFDCVIENSKDKSRINVLKSLTNIPVVNGELVTLITFIDITNLKNKEAELKRAVGRADRATMGKTILLGNVSHDIGNILTELKGSADILHRHDLSDADQELVDIIRDSSDTISTAVSLMRERTLLETGKSKISLVGVNPKIMLDKLKNTYIVKCQNNNITFGYNVNFDETLSVKVDISKLQAVITNLLDNAIKFTENGSVNFDVTCTEIANNRYNFYFVISDTGIGISKDALESIFNIYEQANESIQTTYGGTGIGLSICQHYVLMMGGDIKVESTLGTGSSFEFQLEFEKCDQITVSNNAEITTDLNEDKLQILIAEDSHGIQMIIDDKLKQLNCECSIVSNGRDAVSLIENAYFDMALLDIRMPTMNGIEAIDIIRENKYKLPIIAMTANSSEIDLERYWEHGFDDCISKPISDSSLNHILMKFKNRQLLDIDFIKQNFKTDEFFLQILQSTKEEFTINYEMLMLFKQDPNFENLNYYSRAAHAVKSIASQVGMESVRHIAHILETKFTSGINFQDVKSITQLIVLLQTQFQKSLSYYDDYKQL